jgi:hypothetical protein
MLRRAALRSVAAEESNIVLLAKVTTPRSESASCSADCWTGAIRLLGASGQQRGQAIKLMTVESREREVMVSCFNSPDVQAPINVAEGPES